MDLQEEYAALQRQFQTQTADMTDLQTLRDEQREEILSLRDSIGNLQLAYDTVIENYNQRIAGQSKSLDKANALLAARTRELESKEKSFAEKERSMIAKQTELQSQQALMEQRYQALEKAEAATQKALQAKEKELETVRNSVNTALVGFKDKGLNVDVKDGKVYVSMESKLMFSSASWTVSKEGEEAIKGLAKVLEQNPDLNIMVEGHTDNDAYKGSSAVKDNWDLSVMRATSIVKLLLKYGPNINPARIEAAGHSEYAPKVENNSASNKAVNRRTEIILTPNLDDLLKAVN